MRRWISLLLCAAALLLGSCAYPVLGESQEAEGYALYFLEPDLSASAGGGAFRTETVYLDDLEDPDTRQLAEALMTELLRGPLDETLKNPVPAGTALLSLEVKGSQAVVDFSAPYNTLSGVGLTLADYAVALTLTQLPDIVSVRITVRGKEIAYRDKQVFTTRDVLLAPEGDVVATVPVTLYFLNEMGVLAAEKRTLDLYEGDTQVSAVTKALENGPESKGFSAIWPEGFRVRAVWLEEDLCYVNLSSALLVDLPPDADLDRILRALGRSLCSLDSVSEVRFLVDGEFAQMYGTANVAVPYIA